MQLAILVANVKDVTPGPVVAEPTWIDDAARVTSESLSASKPGRSERNCAISGSSFIRGF
jgi:hypothetical protein